ncbi:Predicted protein [Prochlorococcus marinus subsp. marinus str. CCMP1375]|uniref:Uncharacterized protein n=2 Tax=Prochlorococcaceae TaxID=2881426 RepID=Q7VBJ7_PROMA|nr:Predicted protein [Prochlorococcus marinus subsp. marinus str. CCMP1375]
MRMNIFFHRKFGTRLLLVSIGLLASLSFEDAHSGSLDRIIKSFCLDGFKKEMVNASNKIPKEMGEFTCNCFLQRINDGDNLDSAREVCKKAATQEFRL